MAEASFESENTTVWSANVASSITIMTFNKFCYELNNHDINRFYNLVKDSSPLILKLIPASFGDIGDIELLKYPSKNT